MNAGSTTIRKAMTLALVASLLLSATMASADSARPTHRQGPNAPLCCCQKVNECCEQHHAVRQPCGMPGCQKGTPLSTPPVERLAPPGRQRLVLGWCASGEQVATAASALRQDHRQAAYAFAQANSLLAQGIRLQI